MISPQMYGDRFNDHLLDQYKLYVEMADRISQRRSSANSFFLALHTGLFALAAGLAGLSGTTSVNVGGALAAAIFGLPFSYAWYRVLKSYRQINSAKYAVIHKIEANLPISPYKDEWSWIGQGKNPKLYTPLTHVEVWIPGLYFLGYVGITAWVLVLLLH